MTVLSHLHPNFESVFSIEAANEPIMNATQTPGYGDCKHVSCAFSVGNTHSCLWLVSPEEFREDSACGRIASRDTDGMVSGSARHAQ